MASTPRPQDDDVASVLATYPNYLSPRRATARAQAGRAPAPPSRRAPRRFSPWLIAFLAYLAGAAVYFVVGFVLAMAGLLIALLMGFSGTGRDVTESDIVAIAVIVVIGLTALRVAVQAFVIRRLGGARPWLAPICAAGLILVLGGLFGALVPQTSTLPMVLQILAPAAFELVVLALLIRPRPANAEPRVERMTGIEPA